MWHVIHSLLIGYLFQNVPSKHWHKPFSSQCSILEDSNTCASFLTIWKLVWFIDMTYINSCWLFELDFAKAHDIMGWDFMFQAIALKACETQHGVRKGCYISLLLTVRCLTECLLLYCQREPHVLSLKKSSHPLATSCLHPGFKGEWCSKVVLKFVESH